MAEVLADSRWHTSLAYLAVAEVWDTESQDPGTLGWRELLDPKSLKP